MQILARSALNTSSVLKNIETASTEKVVSKEVFEVSNEAIQQEHTREKIERAINSMNDFLEINHRSTRFVFHDELERYYITVVDQESGEVLKEIPPKKLLDAFYEMQKLVGMIVDEKI